MSSNWLITGVFELAKSLEGNLLELCSNAGQKSFSNISFINSTFVSMWPDGDFRTSYRLFDQNDSNIFNLTYYSTAFH